MKQSFFDWGDLLQDRPATFLNGSRGLKSRSKVLMRVAYVDMPIPPLAAPVSRVPRYDAKEVSPVLNREANGSICIPIPRRLVHGDGNGNVLFRLISITKYYIASYLNVTSCRCECALGRQTTAIGHCRRVRNRSGNVDRNGGTSKQLALPTFVLAHHSAPFFLPGTNTTLRKVAAP